MTDKQAVFDALHRLPESVTLEEIAEELRIMTALRRARGDIVDGHSKTHEQVEKLMESWSTAWTTR